MIAELTLLTAKAGGFLDILEDVLYLDSETQITLAIQSAIFNQFTKSVGFILVEPKLDFDFSIPHKIRLSFQGRF